MSNNEYTLKKYNKIKPGEVFTFAGYEWIKLEQDGLALMKDILEERPFDEESNDWRKSELREYLNDDFYWDLRKEGANEKDFLMIETDLTADDGMKDYGTSKDLISLMTADLFRSNRHLLNPLESWWWLATPRSCLASYSYSARCVYSSGTLSTYSAYIDYYGVRPLINLSPDAPVFVVREKVKKYRKKPVVVEAIKYYKTSIGSAQNFCDKMKYNPHNNEYYIETLEGTMLITDGDYIIKGVNGEFYPCKADIFEKTYEEVQEKSMSRLTAYICAPYAGDIEKNIEKAKKYAKFTHSRGYTPVTPHLMFPFLDDSKQEDRYDCLNMCSDVMKMCDEVFVFGNKLTEGMLYELSQWDSSVYIFTDEMVGRHFDALKKGTANKCTP